MEHYSEEEAYLLAMQISSASVFPMVLKSAIELDLLELIKKGGLVSPSELAAQIPTTNAEAHVMLDRILRLLSSYSVLNCTLKSLPNGGVERLYSLTPVCKYLTKNDDGASLAPLVLSTQDKVYTKSWYHLKDAILEGGVPFYKAYGMHTFEYHKTDPRFNDLFNQAMSNHSTIVMKKILETYKGFEDLKSLVEVGGGIGDSINMIVSKYPSIKGINFDLPHVIEHAPSYPGVEHISGDMFVNVPKGDAIFMKCICHDWSDEHCLKLLMKCYETLPKNGKVILAECIMPEDPDNDLATTNVVTFDVMMLGFTPGGKERTEKEFHALAKEVGFKQLKKVYCAFNYWIIELYK